MLCQVSFETELKIHFLRPTGLNIWLYLYVVKVPLLTNRWRQRRDTSARVSCVKGAELNQAGNSVRVSQHTHVTRAVGRMKMFMMQFTVRILRGSS